MNFKPIPTAVFTVEAEFSEREAVMLAKLLSYGTAHAHTPPGVERTEFDKFVQVASNHLSYHICAMREAREALTTSIDRSRRG